MLSQRFPKNLEQRLFDLTLALYRVTDFFPPGEALRKHLREKANEIFGQILEYNYATDLENAILKILGKIQAMNGYLEIAKSLRVVRPINLIILGREYIFLADFFNKELESLSRTSEVSSVPNLVDPTTGSKIEDEVVSKVEMAVKKEKEKLSSWQDFSESSPNSSQSKENMSVDLPADNGNVRSNNSSGVRTVKSWSDSSPLLNERQEAILEHLKQTQQAKISDFYSFFNNISSKTIQRDLQGLVAKNLLKKEGEKRWTIYSLKNLNVQ